MKLISKNKKAYHDYEIQKTRDVGIVLRGFEVKALRSGLLTMTDAFVRVVDGQCVVKQLEIRRYEHTSVKQLGDYDPRIDRVLLMKKREITMLAERMTKTGFACIPLDMYFNEQQRVKLTIGLVKLMRKVDKKQILKEKEIGREMNREIKSFE